MFTHWTTETSSDDVIIHEFFGPRRLGPDEAGERDLPLPATPLVGSGSMEMQCLGQHEKGHIYRTLPAQRGWAAGTLRTRVHVPDRGEGLSTGMYVCATSTALVGGSGAAYLLGLSTFLGAHRAILAKTATGLQSLGDTTPTILAQSSAGHWAFDTTFTIALSWSTEAGKLFFTYQRALLDDLSDLTTIFAYTDMTPLGSPVSQGLWIDSGTALEAVALYDETAAYREVRFAA